MCVRLCEDLYASVRVLVFVVLPGGDSNYGFGFIRSCMFGAPVCNVIELVAAAAGADVRACAFVTLAAHYFFLAFVFSLLSQLIRTHTHTSKGKWELCVYLSAICANALPSSITRKHA